MLNFFAEMPAQAKALVGGLALLFVIALGANFLPRGGGGATETGAPIGQTLIYSNMEPKIAAEAAAELKEKGIPFQLVRDGTAIAVPTDKADDARIKLAIKALPREGDIGFSQLFGDKPGGFMTTDFEKKVAYDRALNGELSRIIRKIEGIDGASVIINRPEEQLFIEERKPTTASVMVKVAPNRSISKQQVEGIQHLVASSVPGLKTTNVTVVSDAGKLMSDGMADNVGNPEDRLLARALDRQLMMTRERESAIEAKVQSLLDKIFGPGKSVVRVAAELDFTQKRTRTTLYAAPADARGNTAPSMSQKSSEQSSAGKRSGGVPGTTANVPTGPPTYAMAGTGPDASGYTKTVEQVRNDAYSTNQTLTEDEVGTLKRLSVTALIQGLPAERVPAMIQIVAATAGADVGGRGDQIVVQPVAFDSSQNDMLRQLIEQEEKAKLAAAGLKKKDGGIPFSWIIGTGAAFLVLILLLAIMRMANRKEDTTDVLVNTLGEGMPADFDPNALGGQYGYPGGEMMGSVPQAGYGPGGGYGPSNDGPFGFLEEQDPGTVAELVAAERPATAAGILRALNPGFADQVLAYLPPEQQEDLVQRYNTQAEMPAFQQRTLAQQLKRRLGVPV